jgi:hypothetical protein
MPALSLSRSDNGNVTCIVYRAERFRRLMAGARKLTERIAALAVTKGKTKTLNSRNSRTLLQMPVST